jgi:hypothetical protein
MPEKTLKKRGPKFVTKRVVLSVSVLPSTKILAESYSNSVGRSTSYVTEQALIQYLKNNS